MDFVRAVGVHSNDEIRACQEAYTLKPEPEQLLGGSRGLSK